MTSIIIDSNILVALLDDQDVLHERAAQLDSVLPESVKRIYTDLVIGESLSVIARRSEEKKQPEKFQRVLSSLKVFLPPSKIHWITPLVPQYYHDILRLLAEHEGKLNFHDCALALYMRKNHFDLLASFDKDFDSLKDIRRVSSKEDAEKIPA